MKDGLASYRRALNDLSERGRLRRLTPRAGVDFTSNDYLALTASARLRQRLIEALDRGVAIGAGGSRLLRGNCAEHEELEAAAAAHFGAERALYFGGGYMASFAVLATMPQQGDLVLLDERSHASAHEGARAGRALVRKVRHNDPQAFEDEILAWRAEGQTGRVWVCVESLYSMDGDLAPLPTLAEIARRHDALLYVDEAHATGVLGPDGRGLAAALDGGENLLTLHTCGKALGGSGALVCGPRVLRDFLINRGRPFIYSTAPSPLMAVAALEALRIVKDEPQRREALGRRVAFAAERAADLGLDLVCRSQILPVIVGADTAALALAAALQRRGFDVRAIRPPTVPEGTARLRIALTLHAREEDIAALLSALAQESRVIAA